MNFERFGDSSNFLIWIVVIAIVIGFGNCRDTFGLNFTNFNQCNDGRCGNGHNKNAYPCKNVNNGSTFFGGNGLFILLIIALLFLCKENKNERVIKDYDTDEEFGDVE